MTDDKIDFSPLDSSRDPRRWEHLVARTTERALAAQARQAPPSWTGELTRHAWPLTTAAALVAAVGLLMASLAEPSRPARSLTADSVSEWANGGQVPSHVDLVALTGAVP